MRRTSPTSSPPTYEVYVIIKDRRRLTRMMDREGLSARQLAKIAGFHSHSYMNKLLTKDNVTCRPSAAQRIAEYFDMDVNDLFEAKASIRTDRRRRRSVA
jgi:transcriptional regulator with XRE-family HTH domain